MRDERIKSIGIFTVVTVALILLIVGGIRFVKGREASIAHQNTPQITNNSPEQKPNEQQPSQPAPQQETQPQPQPQPSSNAAPQPPVPSTTAQTPTPSPAMPTTGPTPPAEVPATGPSIGELMLTGFFVMLTVYFWLSLRRARVAYRRLLS